MTKKQKIVVLSLAGIISVTLILFYCKSKIQTHFYISKIEVGSKPKE
jgi:hypothetical protein